VVGNRPAHNARHREAAPATSVGWRGGEDATDFLGLDQEVQNARATGSAALELGQRQAAAPVGLDPEQSWLLSLDDARAGIAGLEPVAGDPAHTAEEGADLPAPLETSWSEEAPARSRSRTWLVRAMAAVVLAAVGVAVFKVYVSPPSKPAVARPVEPSRRAPDRRSELADPSGTRLQAADTPAPADARDASRELPPTTAKASDVPPPTVPADEVAVLDESNAGADAATDLEPSTESPGDETGWTDVPLETASSDPATAGEVSANVADLPTAAVSDIEAWWPGGQPDAGAADRSAGAPELDPADSRLGTWARALGIDAPDRLAPIATRPDGYGPVFGAGDRSILDQILPDASSFKNATVPGPAGEITTRSLPRRDSSPDRGSVQADEPVLHGLRRATEEDLAGLWDGATIPLESVDSPSRLLTPAVGRVRAVLKSSAIFEGRLYAVGQGKIWLDSELGRMALFAAELQKIDHLSSPDGTPALGAPGSQELSGLPRVCVRMPGGFFYGKVIARDESTVTLITDEGARVRLESTDIEPAPMDRPVIVRGKL
jgi:hypothetical protein